VIDIVSDCSAVSSPVDSSLSAEPSASVPASYSDVVGNVESTENAANLCAHNSMSSDSAVTDSTAGDALISVSTVTSTVPSAAPALGEHSPIAAAAASSEPVEASADTDLAASASPTSAADGQNVYHVKWIKFHGSQTPIVMQNQNGPCPLLAIVNVLLLQGKIKLASSTDLVASDQLMAYIADWIFDNVPKVLCE